MKKTHIALGLSLALLGACEAPEKDAVSQTPVQKPKTLETLFAFDKRSLPDALSVNNAEIESVASPDNGRAARIRLKAKAHKEAGFEFVPNTPWDWSSYGPFALALDIQNPLNESTHLYLTVTDGEGQTHNRSFAVPAHSDTSYYMELKGHDLDVDSGLRANPPYWITDDTPIDWRWGTKNINLSEVQSVSFSVRGLLSDRTLVIDDVRLLAEPEVDTKYLTGLVDRLGQNAKVDFEGKITDKSELGEQRKREQKTLRDTPWPERSRFGGWKQGPQLEATGYFRTARHEGKWSLVDPDGYLFFSHGIANVRMANTSTMTGYDFDHKFIEPRAKDDFTPEDSKGLNQVSEEAVPSRHVESELRADMFQWLPSYDEPQGKHFGYRRSVHSGPLKQGETYSFYRANLEHKYADSHPEGFMAAWRETTVDRMLSWGFTSFGNWLSPDFYQMDRIPYFANGWIIGNFKTVSSGNDYWSPLPDPFDPHFAERADQTLKQVAAEVQNSQWCVGVFIDNEKSWGSSGSVTQRYGLVLNTLGRDAQESPTKAEFSRLMREKYPSISALNKQWGTAVPDWEAFERGVTLSDYPDALQDDLSTLLHHYANEYFAIVAKAVEKHLPNHLYMGARFADWGMTPEIRTAAATHADVMSYNYYKEGLHPEFWQFLEEVDKPSIIGEFHMGASDSGLFNPGLVHTTSQSDRAATYKAYMNSVLENPYFVGAHWFQYLDSPLTGRAYDGENYNVGFVSVTDRPYPEMIEAAKAFNKRLYEVRYVKP
ncbi:agarase [Marinimicrobium sp. C2-29]|uniref:agarase n=1 Tax=Marinimicrobium sp. C2-29 TaxID=3139825 RepID=UPI00313A16F3